MDIALTNVHLDLGAGRRGTDMGPSALHVAGLVPALRRLGHTVEGIESIGTPSFEERMHGDSNVRFLTEVSRVVRLLADRTESAMDAGQFPLVLGGDHSIAIGTITGMVRSMRKRGQRLGVVWVDAHTDMNTPETSPSGNIHGMPVACLLGHGPAALTSELIAGEPALHPEDVVLVGIRDVDRKEAETVRRMGVRAYTMSELDLRGTAVCLREAFSGLSARTDGIHLSFDLDGVDPAEAPGVGTPVPGGLSLRESHMLCELATQTGMLMGMEMVELNPTRDVANKTGELARWLIESALGRSIL